MEITEIQEKIKELMLEPERTIVFWYDADASYKEEVGNSFELKEGAKLWILEENNWFKTKLLLEQEDTESDYLIYAPFPRPDDRENMLADTFYYSKHFYSDKMVQIMGDLSIPVECQDEMKRFKKFWTSGNVARFDKLQIVTFTKETIDLGILCVLGGVKTLNFEELLKKVLLAGLNDNAALKKMEFYKIDTEFWKMCERSYGYVDPTPSLERFLATMLVTYTDTTTGGNVPKAWKTFLSARKNDVVILMKNFMNNEESKSFYDDYARRFSAEKNALTMLREIPLDQLIECDTLPEIDDDLIRWMISKIEDGMLDEKVGGLTIPQICEERMKPCYHFAREFSKRYKMVEHAFLVIKGVALHEYKPTIDEVVKDYVNNAYRIDRDYRKFYFYMDAVGISEETEKLRDLVENIYTNKYLTDYSYKWNESLTDKEYALYAGNREGDFFSNFVRPFMKEDGREGRVFVIISDGMRYECGRELYEQLELDEKCCVSMDHMLSVLPSETTLGMASLLPNNEIKVDTALNITVDGMKCGNSTADRQKILQATVSKSICCDFDKLMNAKKEELRDLLQDKDLVYVYQNQIDQRGEGMRSENEVFNACEEAVDEIRRLIHRLTGYVSATRFLITADHGFIYKRDKLVESDKISLDKTGIETTNYRYLLSDHQILSDALSNRCLSYLSSMNSDYVITPKGTDIIKKTAGGMNYVHGGSSLQEMIVPVVKVVTAKGRQDVDLVNVEISSFISRITNSVFKIDFMQMEPVTDKVKPRRIVAFFEDANGQKISFDVPITADIRDKEASKRLITERFTLKSGKYNSSQDYFLVLADMDDESQVVQKYKFTIDIAEM